MKLAKIIHTHNTNEPSQIYYFTYDETTTHLDDVIHHSECIYRDYHGLYSIADISTVSETMPVKEYNG